MRTVHSFNKIPENSIISFEFEKYDYCDSYQVLTAKDKTVDEFLNIIFEIPAWIKYLGKIRDLVVKPFGLKTGDDKPSNTELFYTIGSKAVYFEILDRDENEIVMGESDKHLDFRVSIMKTAYGSSYNISLTTIVRFNNLLGKIYFIPVRPFHKLICKSIIKKLYK